ncbi:MAG: DUF4261 domain-containing protein [Bacteroidota bacterium]
MKATFLYLLTSIISMGTPGFADTDAEQALEPRGTLLGIVLLKQNQSLNTEAMISDLTDKWQLSIDSQKVENGAAVLQIEGYQIAIGEVAAPVPADDIQSVAKISYFWENATEEASQHEGHVILSILNAGKNPILENRLFNKLAAAVLENSQSLGVYLGGRSLLLKKEFYLSNTENMSDTNLPTYNWIYCGLRRENGKQSVYTYGMTDFGKMEMEMIHSDRKLSDLTAMMYNIVHYVLYYDVSLKDGETIGMSDDQKLTITESKGEFLEGQSLKIGY